MQLNQMAELPRSNLTLAYDEFGSTRDPAIVLIHGLGTQRIGWPDPLCEQLANSGYRVIRFDNRDIGQSTKIIDRGRVNLPLLMLLRMLRLPARSPYSLEDMAEDTKHLLDHLNISRAHIVGASMGGMIAQLFCALFPHRSLSLTSVMSSSGRRDLPGPSGEVKKHLYSKPASSSKASIVDHEMKFWRLISSKTCPPKEGDLKRFIELSVDRNYPNQGGSERQFSAILCNGDRTRFLQSIRVPSLVIHGRQDPLVPLEAGIDTAKHIRGCDLQVYDDMSHDLPNELLDTLAQRLLQHFRKSETRNLQNPMISRIGH